MVLPENFNQTFKRLMCKTFSNLMFSCSYHFELNKTLIFMSYDGELDNFKSVQPVFNKVIE